MAQLIYKPILGEVECCIVEDSTLPRKSLTIFDQPVKILAIPGRALDPPPHAGHRREGLFTLCRAGGSLGTHPQNPNLNRI